MPINHYHYRKHIGLMGTEPLSLSEIPEGLTGDQQKQREEIVEGFTKGIIKKYIADQKKYVSADPEIMEAIKYLFDEHDAPPANAPLEDIINERQALEVNIRWIEAVIASLAQMQKHSEDVGREGAADIHTSVSELLWGGIKTRFKQKGIKNVEGKKVYINPNRQIMQSVHFLFDWYDAINDHQSFSDDQQDLSSQVEVFLCELTPICQELKSHLMKIVEIEDAAFLYLETCVAQ